VKTSTSSLSPSSNNKPSIGWQHVRKPLTSHRRFVSSNELQLALAGEFGFWLKQILSRESAANQRKTLNELLQAAAASSNHL
jgi:hypothetical protein